MFDQPPGQVYAAAVIPNLYISGESQGILDILQACISGTWPGELEGKYFAGGGSC